MSDFQHFRLNFSTAPGGLTNGDPLLTWSKIKKEKKMKVEIASVTLGCCGDVFAKVIINAVTFFYDTEEREFKKILYDDRFDAGAWLHWFSTLKELRD